MGESVKLRKSSMKGRQIMTTKYYVIKTNIGYAVTTEILHNGESVTVQVTPGNLTFDRAVQVATSCGEYEKSYPFDV